MTDLFNLKGKTAVVTGGAGLLGKQFVKILAGYGATVFVAEMELSRGQGVSQELAQPKHDIRSLEFDITKENSVVEGINAVVQETGGIDIWVNNAYPRTKDWGLAFENIPLASWQKNVDDHLNGYFLCSQKVCEQMKKRKKGSLIQMASIYGVVAPDFSIYEGTPMTMPGAYAAIKGGLVNLTRYLASYYGPHGIRVNCISPGGILDAQPEKFIEAYNRKVPLQRMGKPEDILGALVYLASDASAYVTGHNLVVDGGWTAI